MKIRKVVSRLYDRTADGVSVKAAVQAAVAANVNEPGATHVEAHQRAGERPPSDEGGTDVREER